MQPDTILDELHARGLVHTCTNPETLQTRLRNGPITAYCGIDPTASSLHVGHLLSLQVMRLFRRRGHDVIGLVGGFTGMIGDPSGKSEERNLLDTNELDHNRAALTDQLTRLLTVDGRRPTIVDNRDWFESMPTVEFLRDIGKLVPVSDMLERDSVRTRLAAGGLSFTEFSYQLLQAHDFVHLRSTMGCELQLGGSDQYGNITAGTDMIRRRKLGSAWGLVWPLLVMKDGRKFGKTSTGAVWLDSDRTSPFAFHQFWFNTPDDELAGLLAKFTTIPIVEIDALIERHRTNPAQREAQRVLADELTAWVHGRAAVVEAHRVASALFAGAVDESGLRQAAGAVPTLTATRSEVEGLRLDQLAHRVGMFPSVSVARSTITSGGLYVAGERCTDPAARLDASTRSVVLRRGARSHGLVVVDGE
jgi:tyrosyl-tRNA synthetase